jgi:hypothetical protein
LFASGAVETAFILAMGLHSLIASDPAFELNARRSHLAALKERLANERPDLAVLDLTPEITSAVLGDLQDLAPESKLILWTNAISGDFALQALTIGIRASSARPCPWRPIGNAFTEFPPANFGSKRD